MHDDIGFRRIPTNGIELHVAEAGPEDGPLVVLCHGFPELWYSWRHQIPALAAAGFHVLAPDMRGFGGSDAPAPIDAYDVETIAADVLGLADAAGAERAVWVGHDWGAPVAWHLALRHPTRTAGVAGLSVPLGRRSGEAPTALMRRAFGDTFFYMLYFQEPGVADAELAADGRGFLRRFVWTLSGDAPPGSFTVTPAAGHGINDALADTDSLPAWFTEADLDAYAAAFERTGFTGGLNWYRNIDRNWELAADLDDAVVQAPALFIAGSRDPVLAMAPIDALRDRAPKLVDSVILEGVGHWTQQEAPAAVTDALVSFVRGLR